MNDLVGKIEGGDETCKARYGGTWSSYLSQHYRMGLLLGIIFVIRPKDGY
jgi:hypothetical protein